MENSKQELFESSSIGKSVAAMSLPSVLSNLVTILYNMADMVFVGLMGDPAQTAAVSLAGSVTLLFFFITNLFGVGSASMMSRCLGKKDPETAKRVAAFGFWLTVVSGALMSVIYFSLRNRILVFLGTDETTFDATGRYLFWTVALGAVPSVLNIVMSNLIRAEGEATAASVGVISGCMLNMLLDPFFILPRFLGLGAAGAGQATFISNVAATVYMLGYALKKRKTSVVCLNPKMFSLRKDIAREVFSVGVPAAIQNLLNVAGTVILNKIAATYSAVAISAVGIAHKISYVPNYVSQGVSQGIMPLVGYNYSSGNRQRMKDAILYVLKIGMIIAGVMVIGITVLAPWLIRMFINSDEVVELGKTMLRIVIWMAPFHTADWLAVSVFQATGKGGLSLIFAFVRKIALEIPAMLLLNHFCGILGLGAAQAATEVFMAALAAVSLKMLLDGKMKTKEI